MKKIESLSQALSILEQSINFDKFNDIGLPQADIVPLTSYYKLVKIIEANNILNNWRPNWTDIKQPKWNPYFWVQANETKASGYGLSHPDAYWFTHTDIGSRLTVGTADEARYIAEQFTDLFESAWLIVKSNHNKLTTTN